VGHAVHTGAVGKPCAGDSGRDVGQGPGKAGFGRGGVMVTSSQATAARGMDLRELATVFLLGLLATWLWTAKLIIPALTGPLIDYIKHYESAYLILADITPYHVIMYYYPV